MALGEGETDVEGNHVWRMGMMRKKKMEGNPRMTRVVEEETKDDDIEEFLEWALIEFVNIVNEEMYVDAAGVVVDDAS